MLEEEVAERMGVCPHFLGEGRCEFQGVGDMMYSFLPQCAGPLNVFLSPWFG